MEPITPFWFKQRQCKAEPAGELMKLTGPNLGEAFVRVAFTGEKWTAALRRAADGPDVAAAESANAKLAWEAAFELYRTHVIA